MEFPNTSIEHSYWTRKLCPAGIDEAGRGPIAGPVVAAAVIIPRSFDIPGINDSKKLSQLQRKKLYDLITKSALTFGIGVVWPDEIDKINILNATLKAMKIAVLKLEIKPDVLLIDGINTIDYDINQCVIINGDTRCVSIAAASILAKIKRDNIMESYDKVYPFYKFIKNKGYPTREHYDVINVHGASEIHRKTFKGVV